MTLRNMYQPVANGLRTDHPVADLPFVEDTHIPIDQPDKVEAIGRGTGEGRWGRTDRCQGSEGWVAYTTDPGRSDLAWVVRWHPQHGRSVLLYRMEDSSSAYMAYLDEALLYRAGGYWWDGVKWYRPAQVFDMSRGDYVHREVPAALTVSAADLLATGGADPARGSVISIEQLDTGQPRVYRGKAWLDDLALWELRRDADLHAAACVVQVTAPELAADQLLAVTELAEVAGVAASTLRAYITRGENEVPAPQAVVAGRAMWSRPVAEDWAERRRRSSDGTLVAMSDREHTNLPVGVAEMWKWFTEIFTDTLWTHTDIRKRWALRWRTKPAVREVAHEIGWTAAVNLERIVPISQLAHTLRDALLYKLSDWKRQYPDDNTPTYPITSQAAEMLDWLIRHDPIAASRVVAEVVGEAEREHSIPAHKTAASLRQALSLDGKLDDGGYDKFMEIALPPHRA